jgi:predicted transcriptional regulator
LSGLVTFVNWKSELWQLFAMAERNGIQEEFVALIKSANWRPADAARALGLSKTAVSYYVNGRTDPPERTMNLLRRLVMEKADQEADKKSGGQIVREAFEEGNRTEALAALAHIEQGLAALKEILSRPARVAPLVNDSERKK